MALFKIFKGNKENLPKTITPGFLYITEDTGDIYIDTSIGARKQLNAHEANILRNNPTISLTGDVTSSATTFNGESDINITSTLANSGVVSGSYGPTGDANGSNGTAINIPQITVDSKGRITNVVNRTYTSVDTNTDSNVLQTVRTTNGNFPVLLRGASAGTTTTTTSTSFASAVTINPSTGSLTASKVYGAVWNDYAEFRQSDVTEPGRVICENGDDTLSLSKERLQPGGAVVSDTYGFAIGETDEAKTPIAVSGRVLVYTYEDRWSFNPGDAVCAAPNGTVSKMTREEIITYPERIIGTVSAIPSYEIWGDKPVLVNNRIWIKVK